MDTEHEPIFADYRYSEHEGKLSHFIVTTNGTFTVEILRKILTSYKSLSRKDKKRVKSLIKHANKTGSAINE